MIEVYNRSSFAVQIEPNAIRAILDILSFPITEIPEVICVFDDVSPAQFSLETNHPNPHSQPALAERIVYVDIAYPLISFKKSKHEESLPATYLNNGTLYYLARPERTIARQLLLSLGHLISELAPTAWDKAIRRWLKHIPTTERDAYLDGLLHYTHSRDELAIHLFAQMHASQLAEWLVLSEQPGGRYLSAKLLRDNLGKTLTDLLEGSCISTELLTRATPLRNRPDIASFTAFQAASHHDRMSHERSQFLSLARAQAQFAKQRALLDDNTYQRWRHEFTSAGSSAI